MHQPSATIVAIDAARRRTLSSPLPPPGHYFAVHVRWGDKLSWKESARIELGLYLQAALSLKPGVGGARGGDGDIDGGSGSGRRGLYVATTSQEAASQMIELASRNYPNVTIVEAL